MTSSTYCRQTTSTIGLNVVITLGLAETIESLIGGSDTITTGLGDDIIFGGIDADVIVANFDEYQNGLGVDGDNIVLGDSGYIYWTAGDAGRVYDDASTAAGGSLADIVKLTAYIVDDSVFPAYAAARKRDLEGIELPASTAGASRRLLILIPQR